MRRDRGTRKHESRHGPACHLRRIGLDQHPTNETRPNRHPVTRGDGGPEAGGVDGQLRVRGLVGILERPPPRPTGLTGPSRPGTGLLA